MSSRASPARPGARARAGAPAGVSAGIAAHPERLLTGAVLVLVSFGLVMVYSASSATSLLGEADPLGLVMRQGFYALLGLGAYLVLARIDRSVLRRVAPLALAGAVGLLVLVLVPGVGIEVNGSRRWLGLGSLVQVQPSELAKIALVLWLAAVVARNPARLRRPRTLAGLLGVTVVLAALILVEPDMGTASMLVAAAAAILIVGGARLSHLAGIGAATAAFAVVAILASPYRRERLLSFLDPYSDPSGTGLQAVQAQVAFGTGGLNGVGLGDGLQKVFYLPEAHTDMILATVGEEVGLIGVLAVLAAFAAIAVAGYRIAYHASDVHGQLIATGITTLVVVQAAVNMASVLGLMPITGVPLPFVSYGGSSLVVFVGAIGILVNIATTSQHAARRGVVRALPGPSQRARASGGDRGGGHRRARPAGAGRR